MEDEKSTQPESSNCNNAFIPPRVVYMDCPDCEQRRAADGVFFAYMCGLVIGYMIAIKLRRD